MKVLALEPYYGGSHQAFLDGWVARSRHRWTLLTLPAHKWKWRMRHAPVTLAGSARRRQEDGQGWDVVFASEMLNLAEFLGLAEPPVRCLPAVSYFHENQLTYPVREADARDLHFSLTNMTTALAASEVWFNSAYHRDTFLEALARLLRRMPEHRMPHVAEEIRRKSLIQPPGIETFSPRGARPPGPLRILWVARWEHDKNPETLFEAARALEARGVEFRLSVIGQQFRELPEVFAALREALRSKIDRWGYQQSREEYKAALRQADVVVSTADHEFFGISIVEAIAAGARPLLPRRLAYPEVLGPLGSAADDFFYDGSAAQLATRIEALAAQDDFGRADAERVRGVAERFLWARRAEEMDRRLEGLATQQ